MPSPTFDICTLHNTMGQCIRWKYGSGNCLSPESIEGIVIIVPCKELHSIKQ